MSTKVDMQQWHGRIQAAMSFQSQQWGEWRDNIDFLRGDWFRAKFGDDPERIEVSFIHSFISTLIPAIYFKDPKMLVRSRTSKFQAFSEVMEEALNYTWEELRLKPEVRHAIYDAVFTPPGWIKIGYTAEFGEDIAEIEKQGGLDIGKLLKSALEKTKKTPEEVGILTGDIKEESVFAQFISSWRMLLAPGYHRVKNMPYLIEIEDVPIQDLVRNKLYKKAKFDVKPSRTVSGGKATSLQVVTLSGKSTSPFSSTSPDRDVARLFHVWDRRGQKRMTFAENFMDDTLFEGDWPYALDRFPYYPLIFNEIPQTDTEANAYPISDIKPMVPQLIELSLIRTQMSKHRKRSGTIILIKKGQWTSDQISNFTQAEDVSIVEVDQLSPDVLQNFHPPALPPDIYKHEERILNDLMRESGLKQLLSATPVKGIETLGEARIFQAGSELRTSDKISAIEDFTVDIARGLGSLIWEFYDIQKISEIMGRIVSRQEWPELPDNMNERRRIIQAELNFKIESGSTRPPQDDFVEQKLWQNHLITLKTMFPNQLNDAVLIEQFLKKIKFKDFEKAIIGFEQLEAQVAQAENEHLAQNIPQEVGPNERHDIHLPIHMQMQQTEASQVHVQAHLKMQQLKASKQPGQGGSAQTQAQVTPPEMMRQGSPTGSDLSGSVENLGRGLGESGPT